MKTKLFAGFGALLTAVVLFQVGCASKAEAGNEPVAEKKELTKAELITRGKYLVTVSGCNDCHSPKVFGPHGMALDSSRLLSGHPAGSPMPPIDRKALQPGYWVLMGGDVTSFVGPWGITYAANLTPDSATGIGAWSEETFVKTLRTGKHLGMENGRPVMPPMPWENTAQMTDEDLKALYVFLQALPAVNNRVPAPVPPNEVVAQ